MYYIIETIYVDPNQTQAPFVDAEKIEISTPPAITNSSHEVRPAGWYGTTNGWAVYAHGEYATMEDTCAAIAKDFGALRGCEPNGARFELNDEDIVAAYRPGRFVPMNRQTTADWAYEGIQVDIGVGAADERIAEPGVEYTAEANLNTFTLDSHLKEFIERRRQRLLKEQEQELRDEQEQKLLDEQEQELLDEQEQQLRSKQDEAD